MQDTHDADGVGVRAVDDDMGADQVRQVGRGQVIAAMAKLRVVANRRQRVVDLVAVSQKLSLAPGFAGVAQDIDEILVLAGRA